ncbi:MAG: DegQ family serine endoprotease [Alphaproteobacteria bacterium]|nr:DegQ family serine endoprotease [Alphaproteobacteria bacterium]
MFRSRASRRPSPPRDVALRRVAVFGACFLSLVLLGSPVPAQTDARVPPSSFADLADTLVPAVVNISTTQAMPDKSAEKDAPETPALPPSSPFDEFSFSSPNDHNSPQHPTVHSLGSGFVVDASGLIVTNNHVIAGAEEIAVILPDDTTLKAQIVGRDIVTDLALLKVETKQPLPVLKWGDSNKARVGDWVLAVGNPFGLGGSVTAGIVSARARDIHAGPYDDFLQTDAPINRGNSGGPLVNLDGEVIGINTAIYSPSGGSIGIGFAIPSSLAKSVIEQLQKTGKVERGWFGVRIQAVTDTIADSLGLDKPRGALVTDVDANSPAAIAKVQPGDVVLTFDGKPIEKTRQLPRMVAETQADKTVKVTIWRDGKETSVDVKIALLNTDKLASTPAATEAPRKDTPTVDAVGMSLAKITPDVRKELELGDDAKGVIVFDIDEDGAAAKQGVQTGDIIASVGRDPVTTPEQVVDKIDQVRKAGRKSVLLRIERDGAAQFVAVPLDTKPAGGG